MTDPSGWVSYVGGEDNSHLPDDVKAEVERRIAERREQNGSLLGIVEVRVFEHGAIPQVTFTPECLLGVESSSEEIQAMVARARLELDNWR
jgi:hypothetical protein